MSGSENQRVTLAGHVLSLLKLDSPQGTIPIDQSSSLLLSGGKGIEIQELSSLRRVVGERLPSPNSRESDIETSQWLSFSQGLFQEFHGQSSKGSEFLAILQPVDHLLSRQAFLLSGLSSPTLADAALFASFSLCLTESELAGLLQAGSSSSPSDSVSLRRWLRSVAHFLDSDLKKSAEHPPTVFPVLSRRKASSAPPASQSTESESTSVPNSESLSEVKASASVSTETKKKEKSKEASAAVSAEPKKKEKSKEASAASAPAGESGIPSKEKNPAEKDVDGDLDPSKLDLRVGLILKCWDHPESEKLLCEQIDIGESTGPRSIASGLRAHYSAEEMQGRKVVVLANLKERPMAGFKSQGMVLCACNEDHSSIKLLEPPADANVGDRVSFAGYSGEPASSSQMAKKKILEKLGPSLRTDSNGAAHWADSVFTIGSSPVTAPLCNATVS